MSTIARLAGAWRPVVLVAAGIVTGATLVGPVAARVTGVPSPAALQTRAASCSGYDFHPLDSDTKYAYKGVVIYRPSGGGSGFFTCNPHLPQGAVVTKVQFTVSDRYYNSNVRFCGLVRTDLRVASAGQYQTLADLPETPLDASGTDVNRLVDAKIDHATIDNTRFAYWLQCQLNGAGDLGGGPERIGLVGADVIYQISAANG